MASLYPWQKNDWARLQALSSRPPQGLIFKGSKGIGKFDLAVHFAQSLLCGQPDHDGFACDACPSCHWFSQGSHPDFRLVQPDALSVDNEESDTGKKPSKQISVDQIRGLADFFGMSAHQGGKRVVIIHPAEAMNTNAANALLKNLEEPPQDLLFILVSHKPQQLLPTILSRCLSFSLASPDTECAVSWLQGQDVKNPLDALATSGFSPLQAMMQSEQLGSEEREKLLRAIRQPATFDVFALAEALQKTEQTLVVQWLQQWCFDLNLMKLTGALRYHTGDVALIKKIIEPVDAMNLARLQKYLQTAKREAQHTLNPKLFLESLFFSYRQLLRARD